MSTAQFQKECGAAMRAGDGTDLDQRIQDAYEVVRDAWLAKKHYMPLVKAILGNWTSGNCVEYMLAVSKVLIADGELGLHQHLWARTVKRQVNDFFREYSSIRQLHLSFDDIRSTDFAGFDEFDWSCYSDHRKAASFLLNRIISSLSHWRAELTSYNLDTFDPDFIEAKLKELNRPHIEVKKLPPSNSFKPKPLRSSA